MTYIRQWTAADSYALIHDRLTASRREDVEGSQSPANTASMVVFVTTGPKMNTAVALIISALGTGIMIRKIAAMNLHN